MPAPFYDEKNSRRILLNALQFVYIPCGNDIDTSTGNICKDHIPDMDWGRNLDVFDRGDAVKDPVFRNVRGGFHIDHGSSPIFYPDGGSDDPGRIGHFFSCVAVPAWTGVSGDGDDSLIFHDNLDAASKRAADTG